ncbi:MAG: hypothetical protein AAFV38_04310, partial [Pseudomonadota bacterium]
MARIALWLCGQAYFLCLSTVFLLQLVSALRDYRAIVRNEFSPRVLGYNQKIQQRGEEVVPNSLPSFGLTAVLEKLGPFPAKTLETLDDLGLSDADISRYFSL